MELPDLGARLLAAAEEVNESLHGDDGDGNITVAQMKDAILDVSANFSTDPDDNEMQGVWVTLMNLGKAELATFFMDSLIEKYPEIWDMTVSQTRRKALSQGFTRFAKDWGNGDVEDIVQQSTMVSMRNGSYMSDIDIWFSSYPAAGRNWGNMIRATLTVLWMLTADENHWEEVTGEEALDLWMNATEVANDKLPASCRLHPRRAYPLH